eukprot:maker-scaffold622_size123092-snap-gene-0.18 protein:Tk01111 transcript:maker-scaffold622_size123092-snap-gene-0.18-mRNA-1 annotation:"hypothetical protein"
MVNAVKGRIKRNPVRNIRRIARDMNVHETAVRGSGIIHGPTKQTEKYITVAPGRGLIDNLEAVITLLGMAYHLKAQNYVIHEETRRALASLFPYLVIPTNLEVGYDITQAVRARDTFPFAFREMSMTLHSSPELVQLSLSDGHPLVLSRPVQGLIRTDFTLNVTMQSLVTLELRKVSGSKSSVFAGVHVKFGTPNPGSELKITKKYYLKAMELMKQRFGDSLVFLVVAEIELEARKTFSGLADVHFVQDMNHHGVQPDHFAFSVLVMANHSIS